MKEETHGLIALDEAFGLIVAKTRPLTRYESVSLFDANGRTLGEDIVCAKALPAFDNSAMDGYGIKVSDAGKKVTVAHTIYAGEDASGVAFGEGAAVKIMTGALVPPSVEAVVPFENAVSADETGVVLPDGVKMGANIRRKGEEASVGEVLLKKGEKLNPASVGLLASQGRFVVQVCAKVKIAVISSGDEIIEPWESAKEHQIYNSNASALIALCAEQACDVSYVKLLGDKYEDTVETIKSLKSFDLILTSGGISMGEADFVAKAFFECGLEPIFQKVHLKPGKPTMFGYLGETAVLALPGNPLAATINFYLFAKPIIARLLGSKHCWPAFHIATNKTAFAVKSARASVILGTLVNGEFEVYNHNKYGSGMLTPLQKSNASIILGASVDSVGVGEIVRPILLNGELGTQEVAIEL
jgi:molybdopterin molybdotransferase